MWAFVWLGVNWRQCWWEKESHVFSFSFLNISWKARAGLIVNSGSLSLALPIFIFKTPPRNYWDLVLLVSPIHTHTYAVDLFIKVGAFKAVRRLFIITHSDPPQVLWEAMEKSCYIIIWLDCCRRQCQGTHLCAPEVAPNNQHLWPCGFNRKGPQD